MVQNLVTKKHSLAPLGKALALALTVALAAMMVAPAFATDYVCYDTGEPTYARLIVAAAGSGALDDFLGDGHYLYTVTWWIKNTTSTPLTGSMKAILYSDKLGNTTIEESEAVDLAGIDDPDFTAINFTFSSTTVLTFGETYYMALVTALPLINQNVNQGRMTSGNYAYSNSGWSWAGSSLQLAFTVYTTDLESGGGEGGSDPIVIDTSTTADSLITGFVAFIVPIIVILLPAALLCFITKRVDKWLLLIGITIGVALGYIIMPLYVPLWLVFLVVIGLIGMAYQSVKGGA